MSLNSIQRSAIFTTYNHLRGSDSVEKGRLNRALGLAQSQEERPYETTHESCSCPDFQFRLAGTGQKCKHMVQLLLSDVAEQAEPEDGKADEERCQREQALPAPKPRYGKSKMWKGEDEPDEPGDLTVDEINDLLFG